MPKNDKVNMNVEQTKAEKDVHSGVFLSIGLSIPQNTEIS